MRATRRRRLTFGLAGAAAVFGLASQVDPDPAPPPPVPQPVVLPAGPPPTCWDWGIATPTEQRVQAAALYWEATAGHRPTPDQAERLAADLTSGCRAAGTPLLTVARRALGR